MIASARGIYILNRLNERGVIDYKSIADELGVSEATTRRDFEKLEKQGKLKRVQGGAMRSGGFDDAEASAELTMGYKRNVNSREKRMIAERAAREVADGERVFLDAGTSIAPLAVLLMNRPITIVTYSNLVLKRLTPQTQAEVFVIGGRASLSDGVFLGPFAESMLGNFHFDHAFIGCSGLDIKNNAMLVTEMSHMRMKQLAISAAARAHLLVDRSKLKKTGLFRVAGLEAFENVYIDEFEGMESAPANFVLVKE